jgi:hypothetical protein
MSNLPLPSKEEIVADLEAANLQADAAAAKLRMVGDHHCHAEAFEALGLVRSAMSALELAHEKIHGTIFAEPAVPAKGN